MSVELALWELPPPDHTLPPVPVDKGEDKEKHRPQGPHSTDGAHADEEPQRDRPQLAPYNGSVWRHFTPCKREPLNKPDASRVKWLAHLAMNLPRQSSAPNGVRYNSSESHRCHQSNGRCPTSKNISYEKLIYSRESEL